MKKFIFIHEGHANAGPFVLEAPSRLEAKAQLREMGFTDDPDFLDGELLEVTD